MTLKEMKYKHRTLWYKIAELTLSTNSIISKVDVIPERDKHIESHCYACQYALEHSNIEDNISSCNNCPLDFDLPCYKTRSLYQQWNRETDIETRARLAIQIAETPIRADMEEE